MKQCLIVIYEWIVSAQNTQWSEIGDGESNDNNNNNNYTHTTITTHLFTIDFINSDINPGIKQVSLRWGDNVHQEGRHLQQKNTRNPFVRKEGLATLTRSRMISKKKKRREHRNNSKLMTTFQGMQHNFYGQIKLISIMLVLDNIIAHPARDISLIREHSTVISLREVTREGL
jgi:hypothetical protein